MGAIISLSNEKNDPFGSTNQKQEKNPSPTNDDKEQKISDKTYNTYFQSIIQKNNIVLTDNNPTPNNKKTILLVDDEVPILKVMDRFLSKSGLDVTTAQNGEDALQICRQHEFNLVITDLTMNGLDGYDFFHKLKAIRPNQKIYIMSGYYRDDKIDELLTKGALGILQKPFTIKELGQIIASLN